MSDVKVNLRENGPVLISGEFTLYDTQGNPFDLGGKDTIAICRCGETKNRPFCDGTHKSCGFEAKEIANPS